MLTLHLADGRNARIAVAMSPTSSGKLTKVFFEIPDGWRRAAG